jgi:GPH family glycoside/pentoside/hexuronide:cation symporter|tara:strand:- start:1421 stop:2833 length:1413 start_codon:yes stop_codon:yes gene_type:complete
MNKAEHHQTAAEDRIPISEKAAFGFGSMSQILGGHSIGNLANYVFNMGLGVSPILVGLAQSIPRLVDAFTDPLMGHISDNTRSRWGRRRPYMLVGAILMGLFYAAIWNLPKGWSEYGYFSYFLGTSLLFYAALTVFMVPWSAMGYEMTGDYHERTRLQAWANFFASAGSLLFPWLYWLTQRDVFEDTIHGARWVGAGLGLVLIVTGLISVFVCKEGRYEDAVKQKKTPLWTNVKQAYSNRVFMRLMTVVLLVGSAFFTIMTLSPYITIYYVMAGDGEAASFYLGLYGTSWVISSLLMTPLVSWTATRYGKKKILTIAIFINLLGHVAKIWCYVPGSPLLICIPPALLAAGFAGLWVIIPSMNADICDKDELDTGTSSEGMYSAVYGWFLKTSISVAVMLGGLLLVASGFDASLETAQSESTIHWLRILEAGTPIPMVLAGIFLLKKYPLSEDRMYEIREQLKLRKQETTN